MSNRKERNASIKPYLEWLREFLLAFAVLHAGAPRIVIAAPSRWARRLVLAAGAVDVVAHDDLVQLRILGLVRNFGAYNTIHVVTRVQLIFVVHPKQAMHVGQA